MKMKKVISLLSIATVMFAMTACSSTNEEVSNEETLIVENNEIKMLAEVNGKYFTESTRHGVVFKDGSNGEKSVLRGLADEKEFHQALLDIGANPGNNLTAEDMSVKSSADGARVDGDKLEAVVTWEGQDEEIAFEDIIKASDERKMDLRFGGNLESAKKNNTGCVLCLDSCATGITSDAAYASGTSQNKEVQWFGDDSVLPEDGTKVWVTFRLEK
jgi:hypothetical protein